jgi:hypothetical protein
LTLLESFVFIKLKLKLDFSGKLTLLLHFFVSAIRIFNTYLTPVGVWQSCSILISNTAVWMSLYYFVLELKMIQTTLSRENFEDFKMAKQRIINIRLTLLIISLIYILINSAFYIIQSLWPDFQSYISLLLIIARFFKVSMDFYIEYNFLILLIYFIRQRRSTGKPLKLANFFVIGCIVLLFIMCILQSLFIFVWTFD